MLVRRYVKMCGALNNRPVSPEFLRHVVLHGIHIILMLCVLINTMH